MSRYNASDYVFGTLFVIVAVRREIKLSESGDLILRIKFLIGEFFLLFHLFPVNCYRITFSRNLIYCNVDSSKVGKSCNAWILKVWSSPSRYLMESRYVYWIYILTLEKHLRKGKSQHSAILIKILNYKSNKTKLVLNLFYI